MMVPSPINKPILLFLFICCIHLALIKADRKPDQVIEFFRHGARTPFTTYDPKWHATELQQLTTVGMVQHYKLGKSLAEKYPHLVRSGYNTKDFYLISSTAERCIASAMSHVSSLFRGKNSILTENPQNRLQQEIISRITPFLEKDEINRGGFVPIKIDAFKPGTQEELIFFPDRSKLCPMYAQYKKESKESDEMKQGWNMLQDAVQKANKVLSQSQQITNLSTLAHAYDAFIVDLYEKRPLPGDISDPQILKSFEWANAYYVYHAALSQDVQREILSFHSLNAILKQMDNFREGNNPKKMVLYSGHDINLYIILSVFGVINEDCLLANYQDQLAGKSRPYPNCRYPKFASNLIFEFYNDTKAPYVKFYYNDKLIRLCGNQDHCTYNEFIAFVQKSYGNHDLESWKEICTVPKASWTKRPRNPQRIKEYGKAFEVQTTNIWLIIGPILFILFGLSFVCILKRFMKRNSLGEGSVVYAVKELDEDDQSEIPDQADASNP